MRRDEEHRHWWSRRFRRHKRQRSRSDPSSSSSSSAGSSDDSDSERGRRHSNRSRSSSSASTSGDSSDRSSSSGSSQWSDESQHRKRRQGKRKKALVLLSVVIAVCLVGLAIASLVLQVKKSSLSAATPSTAPTSSTVTTPRPSSSPVVLPDDASLDDIASAYSMTPAKTHTLPFPTATLKSDEASTFMKTKWSEKGHGNDFLSFVDDPFPSGPDNKNESTVLSIAYPKGSYSAKEGGIGGAKFVVMDADRAMLSFEVAFARNFDFVNGGKLNGLFAGDGACSGGTLDDTCTSLRFMWRKSGEGEVYAYVPQYSDFCESPNTTCNDEYGQSLGRGSWTFQTGKWQQLVLISALNSAVDVANGLVAVYVDGKKVLERSDILYNNNPSVSAKLKWNALYISSFFGGSGPEWASSVDTNSYFRNFRFWTGEGKSDAKGVKVSR